MPTSTRPTAFQRPHAERHSAGDELSGQSVFYKDETGAVFHTYSCFARGDEQLVGTYDFLELTPKGRNETGPNFDVRDWLKRHDEYTRASSSSCCHHA